MDADDAEVTRRSLFGLGARAAAPPWAQGMMGSGRPYLEGAKRAGRWVDALEVHRGVSTVWPVEPGGEVRFDLYSGVAGVVLLQLGLHRAGEKDALTRAMAGANALMEHVTHGEERPGLYTGLAGIAWVLDEVYLASRAAVYRDNARVVARTLIDSLPEESDVVFGLAGVGMCLSALSERFGDPGLMDAAVSCGERLLEQGPPWKVRPGDEAEMPGFSHGTAGVAAFLAGLYRATGQERFLTAARAGGSRLISLSVGDLCMIPRKVGEELHYSGWCHGPTGTARAFHALNAADPKGGWAEWVIRCARSVLAGEGFTDWGNLGECCGAAGKVSFFVDLYAVTGSERWLSLARPYADDILRAAIAVDGGICWSFAEHRVRPKEVAAQTGLMQGASGIGLALLRLDAALAGESLGVPLPDNPFRRQ